jgi:hypothetical protein
MSPSSRATCDSSTEAAGVRAGPLNIRWWTRSLRAAWQCLAGTERYKWVDRYPASEWLRRDLGLTEDDVTSAWDRIEAINRKHSGWV